MANYERIGRSYRSTRRSDPRIAERIDRALGTARTVVNVGAGTGSYEPTDRLTIAVEPSPVMLAQRPTTAAPAVRAAAEELPFADGSFDAALAISTVHHWRDLGAGLAEIRRVAGRQVIFLCEPALVRAFWLVTEYLPEIGELPSERLAPGVAELQRHLAIQEVMPVPIPADCMDGFTSAFWGRPEAYLQRDVQAGTSSLAQLSREALSRGLRRLHRDLESGAWDERHGILRDLAEYDTGYRIVVAE